MWGVTNAPPAAPVTSTSFHPAIRTLKDPVTDSELHDPRGPSDPAEEGQHSPGQSEGFRRPPGRYGPDRRGWSAPTTAAVVALALLFTGAVVAVGWRLSNPAVSFQVRAFDVKSDEAVELTFLVRRKDPDAAVTCLLRARSTQNQEVGRRTIVVPPGKAEAVTVTVITTTARATLAEVQQCQVAASG
jgi:hypothetical protein